MAGDAPPAGGGGGDWRSLIPPSRRAKVVDRIIDELKKCLQNNVPEALRAIAIKVEEKYFTAATNMDDYLRKITLKIMTLEKTIQNASTSPSTSIPFSESQMTSNKEFGAKSQVSNQWQLHAIPKVEQSPVNAPLLPQNFQRNSPPDSVIRPINHTSIPAIFGPNISTITGSQNSIVQSQVSNQGQPLALPKFDHSPENTPLTPQNFRKNTDPLTAHGTSFNPYYNVQCAPVTRQSSPNGFLGQDEVPNTVQRQVRHSHFNANHIRQLPMQNIRQQCFFHSNMQDQLPQEYISMLPDQFQSPHLSFMEMTQPKIIQSDSHSNLRENQVRQAITSSMYEHLHSTSVGRQDHAPLKFDQLKSTSVKRQSISIPQKSIMQSREQLIDQRPSISNVQQRQLLGQQNRVLNFSGIHKNQQNSAENLGVTNAVPQLQTHQPSSTLLESQSQQTRCKPSQRQLYSDIQTMMQLQQELVMRQQPDSLKQETDDPHSSDSVLQLENKIENNKQSIPSNAEILVASSSSPVDTATKTENATQLDWQEDLYQKIQSMKEKYFEDLNHLQRKFSLLIQQHEGSILPAAKAEQLKRLGHLKCIAESCIKSLVISKSRIDLAFRGNFPRLERQISGLINIKRNRKTVPSQPASAPDPHQESSFTKLCHANMGHLQPSRIASSPHPDNSSQQTNSFTQNSSNTLQPNISLLQPSSALQNEHLKWQRQQKNTELLLQQQKKQQLSQQQFHQQHKQQQSPNLAMHQIPESSNGEDEPETRQGVGLKLGKCDNYHHHALNTSSSLPTPTTQDQHTPMLSFPKADSSFYVPSTQNETEKICSTSAVPSVATCGHQTQPNAVTTLGRISSSPLHSNFAGSEENKASVTDDSDGPEKPINRLIKAVQSMSPEELRPAIEDILGVVSLTDRIAGSAPGCISRPSIGKNVAVITNCHLQDQQLSSQYGRKMKRDITSVVSSCVPSASGISDSLNEFHSVVTSESESTASTCSKRRKIAASHALVDEIREINRRLIDTVLSISNEDKDFIDAASKGHEGTIIKLSFSAVSISPGLKSHLASSQMSLIMPLRLLVPANYPKCSPIFLDNLRGEESLESGDLSTRMQSRFIEYLCGLSQLMSLREIAIGWDACARKVIEEYALQNGGDTFSSRFGGWQSFPTS